MLTNNSNNDLSSRVAIVIFIIVSHSKLFRICLLDFFIRHTFTDALQQINTMCIKHYSTSQYQFSTTHYSTGTTPCIPCIEYYSIGTAPYIKHYSTGTTPCIPCIEYYSIGTAPYIKHYSIDMALCIQHYSNGTAPCIKDYSTGSAMCKKHYTTVTEPCTENYSTGTAPYVKHYSEWVSSFLTAHQHNIGYAVPCH